MRHAISLPNDGNLHDLVRLAIEAEQAGWDAVALYDHTRLTTAALRAHDPVVVASAVMARTTRIAVNVLVTPTNAELWQTGRQLVSLDQLSGGRLIVTVSPAPERFDPVDELDLPMPELRRADRVAETVATLAAALRGRTLNDGSVQVPGPPIWVAAVCPSTKAYRRTLRWNGTVALGPQGSLLRPCELGPIVRAMRGPDGHEIVAGVAPGERACDYATAGATWALSSSWPTVDRHSELRDLVEAGPR